MVRAVQKKVYVGAVLAKRCRNIGVNPLDVVGPVETASDPSLVAQHCHWDASVVEPSNCFWHPIDELDAVNGADVTVVDDDRTVAVEQEPRARALLALWRARDALGVRGRAARQGGWRKRSSREQFPRQVRGPTPSRSSRSSTSGHLRHAC